jgi:hypothetical protein
LDGFSVTICGDKIDLPDGENSNNTLYYLKNYPVTFPPADGKVSLNGKVQRWYGGKLQATKPLNDELIDYTGTAVDFFFPPNACGLNLNYYGYELKAPLLADGTHTGFICTSEKINIQYENLQPSRSYSLYVGIRNPDNSFTWNSDPIRTITNFSTTDDSKSISLSYDDITGGVSDMYGKEIFLAAKGGNLPLDNTGHYPQPIGDHIGPFMFVPPFPKPTVTYDSPSCFGDINPVIHFNFSSDSVSRYDFTISHVNPDNSIGTTSNVYVAPTSNNHFNIDTSNLLVSEFKPTFSSGRYELKAELKGKYGLSCIFDTILTIPERPQLILQSAAPQNTYSSPWSDIIYNIKGYGATDGININLAGGTAPYQYSIDNGVSYSNATNSTSYTYSGVAAGDRYIKIKDANNCKAKGDTTVHIFMHQPDSITVAPVNGNIVSCHIKNIGNHNDGSQILHIHGGIGPYTGSLVPNPGNPSQMKISNDSIYLTGMHTDNYALHLIDEYNFHKDTMVIIASNPELILNPIPESAKTWPDCIGGANGSVTINGQGGKPFTDGGGAYKFVIETRGDTARGNPVTLPNLEATTYNIRMRDQLGCEDTLNNIKIPQNPRPLQLVLTDTIHPTCYTYSDGKAKFTHRYGVSLNADTSIHEFYYTLTNLATLDYIKSPACDTGKFEQIKKGFYRIEISDKNDCPINYAYSDTIFISEPDSIVITTRPTPSQKGKHNGSIWFKFTGGNKKYNYQLFKTVDAQEDSLVAFGTTRDSAIVIGLARADYWIHVKDTCNCTNGYGENDPWLVSNPITISEPDKALGFTVTEQKNVSCHGRSDGHLVVHGTGGWGNNFLYGLQPDQLTYDGTFGKLLAGLYTVYIKDELNEIFSDTVRITEPAVLSASMQLLNNVSCNGKSDGGFNLDIQGGTQPYFVSLNNNLTKTPGTGISGLPVNTYHVLVSDTNQCRTSIDVSITQPDPLGIRLDALVNTLCSDSTGQISVICSGGTQGYSYQWTAKNNTIGSRAAINKLAAGIYKLNLTDAHQCRDSASYVITNTDGPEIKGSAITPVSCLGNTDGRAKIFVENGLKPYTYFWSNGQTQDSAINLSSETYMVMVTDQNKCPNSAIIEIPHPDSLTITATSIDNPQCYNYTNGSITVTGNGGTPSYQYAWSNSNTGNNNTGLRTGDYIATVTDAHNCKVSKAFSLFNPEPVIIDLGEATTVCTGQTVALDAGDFVAYNWTSDNGFTSSKRSVTLSDADTYYLQVMDKNSCLGRDTFILHTSSSLLDALFLIAPEATVGDTVVAIDISWPEPDSIHWVYDNNLVHGRSRKDYEDLVFTKAGTYLITMNARLGNCRDSYSHEISIKNNSNEKSLELGAKDPLIQDFIIRPNPNSGNFTAEVILREQSDISLKLYNFSTLTNQKELKGQDNYIIEYSIPNLSPGVYIMELVAGSEHKMLKMIIY